MAIDIEKLSDEEKETLITELKKSLKKTKSSKVAATPKVVSKGQGSLGASIAQRRAQLR